MTYDIKFSRWPMNGDISTTMVGTLAGTKRTATRIYNERFSGPWKAQVFESDTGKLVASRIGFGRWSNAQ